MKEIISREMHAMVQAQLAIDLNCTVADLNGKKDTLVFVESKENPGRRPFPRKAEHFEMLTMGKSIVVSTTPVLLEIIQPLLAGKDRDSAFSMPFVYGHSLYYLPEASVIHPLSPPEGYAYALAERADMPSLYQTQGFDNAVSYDINHPRPDALAVTARRNGFIVGMCNLASQRVAYRAGFSVAWVCAYQGRFEGHDISPVSA